MATPKTRKKTTAPAVAVPQNLTAANEMVRELGITLRHVKRIETDMAEALAAVREKFEAAAKPHQARAADTLKGLEIWATANRDTLTNGGKVKYVNVPAGEIKWRKTPPACSIKGADDVIKRLKAKFKAAFITTKESINKEAILNTADDHPVRLIEGITITSREEFVVTPHEAELADQPKRAST